jgi:hypothetical protein
VAYDGLYAVAFRLDPCFGQLGAITDPSQCANQLRVVFQPVVYDDGSGPIAQDAAIHAFYSITREQLLDIASAIVAAREAAGGSADLGPLAPNSVVVQQGFTGAYAQKLMSLIVQYAGAANLVRFTSFQIELIAATNGAAPGPIGGLTWDFSSFTVANGAPTPRVIPTLADQPTTMGLSAEVNPLEATLVPGTTSTDNLDLLTSYSQAMAATPAALGSALDSALRIENPHDNSPDTIDCASCHMAQPAIQLVAMPLGMSTSGNSDAFVPASSIPAADLAQTTMLVDSSDVLNVHAFSYRNASPMINQRVINETAANLAYVSTLMP